MSHDPSRPRRRTLYGWAVTVGVHGPDNPRRPHPVRNTGLLACLVLVLISATASLVNPVVVVIVWAPPIATYVVRKLPGELAAVIHDHMAGAIGTAIGVALVVLLIWGLLIGGPYCCGWGTG